MSIKITRNGTKLSANQTVTLVFDSAKTLGQMVAASAYGATPLLDKRGRMVPRYGDTLDVSAPGLLAENIDFEAVSSTQWTVNVSYGTRSISKKSSAGTNPLKPWTQRAQVRWSPVEAGEVCDRFYQAGDTKGNPTGLMLNTNRRPYTEPPIRPISAKMATVLWATQNSIASAIETCEFTVNNASIKLGAKTIAAYTGYIGAIVENEEYLEDGTVYYTHEASVEYRPDGHRWKPIARDYMAVIDGKLRKVQIKANDAGTASVYGWWGRDDKEAAFITEPVLLNASGGLLTIDPLDATVTPVTKEFVIRPESSWTQLEID